MKEIFYNLFSKKELYEMAHSPSGKNREFESIPVNIRRKLFHENMHLMDGLQFTSKNNFAVVEAYTGNTDFESVSYSDRNRCDGKNQAVHFFLHDYIFRNAVWERLEQTTFNLSKFDYYFAPDFSMWVDLPTEYYNKQNLYRNRFITAYWQKCGYQVIPTASWGNFDSLSYCFEGLPENSILAVSGMGHHHCKAAEILWHYALQELVYQKHPIKLLVYGDEETIPDIQIPVKFIPCFITKRLRHGRI